MRMPNSKHDAVVEELEECKRKIEKMREEHAAALKAKGQEAAHAGAAVVEEVAAEDANEAERTAEPATRNNPPSTKRISKRMPLQCVSRRLRQPSAVGARA